MTMDHFVFTVGSPGTQRTLNKYLVNESLSKHIYVESRSAMETQQTKKKRKRASCRLCPFKQSPGKKEA